MTHPASPERPIAKGDLVCVVRVDHHCADRLLGRIRTVLAVNVNSVGVFCPLCGQKNIVPVGGTCIEIETGCAMPPHWLKRIDPGALSESTGEPAKEVA